MTLSFFLSLSSMFWNSELLCSCVVLCVLIFLPQTTTSSYDRSYLFYVFIVGACVCVGREKEMDRCPWGSHTPFEGWPAPCTVVR